MTTFLNRPTSTRNTPVWTPSQVSVRGRRICGNRWVARSIGPATSWGKKEMKRAKSVKRRTGPDRPAVHVDRVAHRLERVERDADREHERERGGVHLEAQRGEGEGEAVGEEAEVLEGAEDRQLGGGGDEQEALAAGGVVAGVDGPGEGPVDRDREEHEAEEAPVPPAVKDQAGAQQQEILAAVRA
jgi:hypothetical protein